MEIITNKQYLPVQSVSGRVDHPLYGAPYRVGRDGIPRVVTGTGGIVYNVQIGDNCMKWVADHLEPGASIRNPEKNENEALHTMACIGNEAVVVTGDAKGAKGYVTGKHGGLDRTLVHFKKEDLEKLNLEDKVLVKACGQGLAIEGFAEVHCLNVDPVLLEKLGVTVKDGLLEVPVAYEIPAVLMGSGIGSASSHSGDYDITTGDPELYEKLGLGEMRFGDIVLLQDCYNRYGREYLSGAVSIGVVVHGDSALMGHGPGVTTIMTCKTALIKGVISKTANLADILGV